jgi:ABC-2 type transport system permease protein
VIKVEEHPGGPTMLILVAYAFSISVNTVATGAVTEATNLSVRIVDEDGSDLSREIAEGLVQPTFQPAVQIRHPRLIQNG